MNMAIVKRTIGLLIFSVLLFAAACTGRSSGKAPVSETPRIDEVSVPLRPAPLNTGDSGTDPAQPANAENGDVTLRIPAPDKLREYLQKKEWDEIVLVCEDANYAPATIPIEHPKLKEELISIFTFITGEETHTPHNLLEVYFHLGDGNERIRIQVGDHGLIAFPDWYGMKGFGTNGDLRPIVDALLKRPDYMPEAPFEERLWDTGLIYFYEGEGNHDGYLTSTHRMKLVAQNFIPAEKKQVPAPDPHPEKIRYLLRLYAHGGTIEFVSYEGLDNLLKVADNGKETWYEMDEWTVWNFRYVFAAG
ncbi:MAG: hypothetical protein A9Z00_12930 [Thermobacillus sp. ZCTH02-B1]|nr:MAG: hypothetical protein A9Z00_12930 [Thermobacillus sp. ZCTH02-B1]